MDTQETHKPLNLDYFQLLGDSFRFAWENKALWVLGLVIGFFQALGNANTNFDLNPDSAIQDFDDLPFANLFTGLELGAVIALALGLIVGLIIVSLVVTYIGGIINGGIITAFKERQAKKLSVGEAFSAGARLGTKIFIFNLWQFLIGFVITAPAITLVIFMVVGFIRSSASGVDALAGIFGILVCCLALFLIPYLIICSIFMGIMNITGLTGIVYRGLKPLEAIKLGVSYFRRHTFKFVPAALVYLIPLILWSLLTGFLGAVVALPGIVIATAAGGSASIFFNGVFGLIGVIIATLAAAPFVVFNNAYWVGLVEKLFESEE